MFAGLVIKQMFLVPIDDILETFVNQYSPYALKNMILALWIIINLVPGMLVLSYSLALYTLHVKQEIVSVPLAIAHTCLSYFLSWQIVYFTLNGFGIDFPELSVLILDTGDMHVLFWAIILQSLCLLIFVWMTHRLGIRSLDQARQTST